MLRLPGRDSVHSDGKARMQFLLPLSLATRLGSVLLFLAEFLEARIIPERIEHRIELEQRRSER
jgi:hypothetical protein